MLWDVLSVTGSRGPVCGPRRQGRSTFHVFWSNTSNLITVKTSLSLTLPSLKWENPRERERERERVKLILNLKPFSIDKLSFSAFQTKKTTNYPVHHSDQSHSIKIIFLLSNKIRFNLK